MTLSTKHATFKHFTCRKTVISFTLLIATRNSDDGLDLKGVLAKNERGYRLNAIKKRF